MWLLLDTDHLTILQQRIRPQCDCIQARLEERTNDTVATTIVSLQEIVQGWLSYLNRAHRAEGIVRAYSRLEAILDDFRALKTLAFGNDAQTAFSGFRSQGVRIGTMDLRIASVAVANDAILLSGNLKDFRRVPGLRVEDWSRPNQGKP